MKERVLQWAKALRREVLLLWLAARDPQVPLPAKMLATVVVGYALSPIDLIPDFIPVLGLLDDLLLIPAGVWLTMRMISPDLRAELRAQAQVTAWPKPSRRGAALIVLVWLGLAGWAWSAWQRS